MTSQEDVGLRRRPVQRRSAERYERILNACAALLDEGGYAALSTTTVARRAEVPIGTLYQFFADKDALIHALAARNLDHYLERLAARLAAAPPAGVPELIDLAVDEFVAMRRTLPGFGVVDFGAGGRWDGPEPDDVHLLDEVVDNNTAVVRRMRALSPLLADDDPQLELALRVALECADAVLKLAFRSDPDGDPELIAECKRVVRVYLVTRSGDSPRESPPSSTLDAPVEQRKPTRITQPARHDQRGAGTDSHHHEPSAAGMSVATNLRTGPLGDFHPSDGERAAGA